MKRFFLTLSLIMSLLCVYTVVGVTVTAVTPQYAEARSKMGGKSFRMTRPAQKQAPASNNRMQNQSGGFSRGLMGGLLGGAIGGMLFGSLLGSGGQGMGLLLPLLLAGGAWFLWRRYKSSQGGGSSRSSGQWKFPGQNSGNQQKPVNRENTGGSVTPDIGSGIGSGLGSGLSSGLGSDSASESGTEAEQQPLAETPMEVTEGLAQIRQYDRSFDEDHFKEVASDVFFQVQAGWMRRDLSSYRHLLGDQLVTEYEKHFAEMREKGIINKLESIAIRSVEIVAAGSDGREDFITVRFIANLLDYNVSDTTGKLVDGDMNTPVKFEEEWSWARPTGTEGWKLEGLQ
ncbi:MAG: Tim44 domain-containing protein [Desulforhopalus sp.]|nr:Tim44 domain-containing protein [Desulforhopalus sp.]